MSSLRFFGSAVVVAAVLAAATQTLAGPPDTKQAAAAAAHTVSTPSPVATPASPKPSVSTPERSPSPAPTSPPPAPEKSPPAPAKSLPASSEQSPGIPPQSPVPDPSPAIPPGEGHTLYLSFDDGPDPKFTPTVLQLLADNGAHATFFMIGRSAATHPDLVAEVRAGGHGVADHTMTHADLTKLSTEAARNEVARTAQILGGASCTRPPYGAVNTAVTQIITGLGQRVQLWDIDTRDWSRPGAASIAQRVRSGARDGAVVLFHDGGGDRSQTVQALRTLLPQLRAAGWHLEAIPGC